MNNRPAMMTGLRPRRSPAGPADSAPTMIPTLDMTKAEAKAGGGTFHACAKAGAAMPIELRS